MTIHLIDRAGQNWSKLCLVRRGPWLFSSADSALGAMVDFREVMPVTVGAGSALASALEAMRVGRQQSAFVLDPATQAVVGLITAVDCMYGLSPAECPGPTSRAAERVVEQLMWPVQDWKVVDMTVVQQASLGAIYVVLRRTGIAHLPVIEGAAGAVARIRGLFSAIQVQRMLLPSQADRDAEDRRRVIQWPTRISRLGEVPGQARTHRTT